jgi:pyrimidine operon attenuation protein/uracil phosphoribosyltransferase
MTSSQTEVLNHQQITDRIRRIAWQIFEDFANEPKIILAGIAERGHRFAELIKEELDAISPIEAKLIKVVIHKDDPLAKDPVVDTDEDFEDKQIIVVDDVLNSGATLIYGVRFFLKFRVKGIRTAVLVDRSHKRYPVKGDFKGISLSTGIMEHVEVQILKEPYSVVIS